MTSDSTMVVDSSSMDIDSKFYLDSVSNGSNGRVEYYRGELHLNKDELNSVNTAFSKSTSKFGKPQMIEVKSPPLIPAMYPPSISPTAFSALPARATRGIMPTFSTTVRTSAGGKGGKSVKSTPTITSIKPEISIKSEPLPVSAQSEPQVKKTMPSIKPNRFKIQSVIREAFIVLTTDPDYQSLLESQQGHSPPVTLATIRDRVEAESYADHFQFMDDLVAISSYWLQGPPQPNPMYPQYMAALKLARNGTDLMMNSTLKISNDDYYSGPNIEETIKEDIRLEKQVITATTVSPSYARKVRRTDSTSTNVRKEAATSSELRNIEEQVTMLTQHVLGLHKASSGIAPAAGVRQSASADSRPLSQEEVGKLESDLMKLTPDDIDYIVTNLLKDEPSVRVDDESYELDVSALPASKQRNLRRYVTKKLNMKDPGFGAQKLKQMLKDDELAKASEEMAERLLASSSSSAPPMIHHLPPLSMESHMTPEEELAERQRVQRDQQRDEEAKRLWQLAHGDDDEDMNI